MNISVINIQVVLLKLRLGIFHHKWGKFQLP